MVGGPADVLTLIPWDCGHVMSHGKGPHRCDPGLSWGPSVITGVLTRGRAVRVRGGDMSIGAGSLLALKVEWRVPASGKRKEVILPGASRAPPCRHLDLGLLWTYDVQDSRIMHQR